MSNILILPLNFPVLAPGVAGSGGCGGGGNAAGTGGGGLPSLSDMVAKQ